MDDTKFKVFKLENSLRLLHIPTRKFNSVFVLLIGKAGRRSETEEEVGSAHFLEHLLFDGTRKRPGAFEINKVIEEVGGAKNGFTHQESVHYFVKVLPEKIEVAFDFLSDIFLNSLLQDQDIRKERKVISQEAMMKKDDPDDLLHRMHLKLLYPNQNLGRNILDEWQVIDRINKPQLLRFKNKKYVANNFVLAVVGNVSQIAALGLARKYFSQLPSGKEVHFSPASLTTTKTIKIENKDFEQTKLAISFRGYSSVSDQMYIARMLAIVLGAGFSSRLYDKLRTKSHLVYSIGVGNNDFTDTGYFSIETKTSEDKVQQALGQTFAELCQIAKRPVAPWELDRAKNRLRSWFAFKLEDISFYAWHFAEQLLFKNEIKDVKSTLVDISKVSRGDILEVAQHIFSDQPKISLLTPKLTDLEIAW